MKKIVTVILLIVTIVSCKKDDKTYQGPPFVDFPVSYQYVVIRGDVYSDYTVPVKVRMGGAQSSSPQTVTFEVDPASVAVSGTHYSFDSKSFQIPANSSFGEIPVKFLIPSFPEQTSTYLILTLTGGDLKINKTTSQTVLVVYRQGFIDIFTGNYNCQEPDVPVSVNYDVVLEADTSVKNRILISNFWGYADDISKVYIDLKSTVDSVYLPSQSFTDKANRSYTVSGAGRYVVADGSIWLSYTLTQNSGSFTESGEQVYTRK